MSDFGSMITVKKSDGCSVSAQEIGNINDILSKLNNEKERTDASGEIVSLKAVKSIEMDGTTTICVMVTEYWNEGLDQGFYFADSAGEVLDQDKILLDEIIRGLKENLPSGFTFEPYSGGW